MQKILEKFMKKYCKNAKKTWKSQGNSSVQKSGNHEVKRKYLKCMGYEVTVTIYMSRIANLKKSTKMAAIEKLHVRTTKCLMCIFGGHMCIIIPNMKFVSLTLWLGEVCTDDFHQCGC